MNDRKRFRDRSNGPGSGRTSDPRAQRSQGRNGGQKRQHNGQNNGQRGGGGQRNNPAGARPDAAVGQMVDGIAEGLLSIPDDRSDGTLRDIAYPLRAAPGNVIVPRSLIRDLNLRPGLLLKGPVNGRNLDKITTIEGRDPDLYANCLPLYESTALDPSPVMKLEHSAGEYTTRIIDIITPIGFGQRGLIVAPPRTGKTILMQNIARGINANYPNVKLVLLLIDERPEEVTDMRRNVPGTVYASSNDNGIDKHLDLAQLVIERCKRQVELGEDIVVLMDSLTRVGRAFNAGGPNGGRTMSGGLDSRALEIPKKLFGAARKIESRNGGHGGSLTIMATCLIDTGSRMDQIIFEEFKGTGNMELTLDRTLANNRIFPAIDIASSGTRKEEKLLDEKSLGASRNIRRHLMNMPPTQAMKSLVEALSKHKTNQSFYDSMKVEIGR